MRILHASALLLTTAIAAAGHASADHTCGPVLDTCGGSTDEDNLWAGCAGTWRDIFVAGTYAQVCLNEQVNAWVCPESGAYGVNHPSCRKVTL